MNSFHDSLSHERLQCALGWPFASSPSPHRLLLLLLLFSATLISHAVIIPFLRLCIALHTVVSRSKERRRRVRREIEREREASSEVDNPDFRSTLIIARQLVTKLRRHAKRWRGWTVPPGKSTCVYTSAPLRSARSSRTRQNKHRFQLLRRPSWHGQASSAPVKCGLLRLVKHICNAGTKIIYTKSSSSDSTEMTPLRSLAALNDVLSAISSLALFLLDRAMRGKCSSS